MSICIIPSFLLLWTMLQRLFMVQVSWCAGVHTEKLLSLVTSDPIIQLCLSRIYYTRLSSQAQWPKVNQPFHCQDLPGPAGPKALPGSLPMPLSPRFSWHAGPHCLCLVEGEKRSGSAVCLMFWWGKNYFLNIWKNQGYIWKHLKMPLTVSEDGVMLRGSGEKKERQNTGLWGRTQQ